MLDDDAGCRRVSRTEGLDRFPGRIGIADVVVGKLLALQLLVAGDAARHGNGFAIERGLLVRILTIAHGIGLVEGQLQTRGEGGWLIVGVEAGEPVGDGAIVARGVHKGFLGQRKARGVGDFSLVRLQLIDDAGVVGRLGHDGAAALLVTVVFRRSTHHGRAADVDVLDGVGQRAILFRNRLLEGIEVHHDQVDGGDAVLFHGRGMFGVAADAEDAAMHLGMQGLDATVEHFREAGVVGNVGDIEAGIAQQLGGAAS